MLLHMTINQLPSPFPCSGPNDYVFVYFADHGAPGIVAFPDEMVSSPLVSPALLPLSLSLVFPPFCPLSLLHAHFHSLPLLLQLSAKKWNDAIMKMHQQQKYKQMVIYVESCESGSMFNTLLPDNINGEHSMVHWAHVHTPSTQLSIPYQYMWQLLPILMSHLTPVTWTTSWRPTLATATVSIGWRMWTRFILHPCSPST